MHSPKLTLSDRLSHGLLTALVNPKRLSKIAVIIKPRTYFNCLLLLKLVIRTGHDTA